jgi:hypothetical protein
MHVLTGVRRRQLDPAAAPVRSHFQAYNILVFKGIFPVAAAVP